MDKKELWWNKAEEDMEAAEFMKKNGKYPYSAFLYQQAVEKALKSLLIKEGKGVMQTHDLFLLAKNCKAPGNIKSLCDRITPYYFRTRYPDTEMVELEKEDIEYVAESSKEVFEWIRKKL